jgi:hypothetical protein
MAHFAKIEDGIVTNVVVVDNEHETYGEQYLNDLGLEGTWKQTSYNNNFGGKYAAIGDVYDEADNTFKPVKPYASWTWNVDIWSYEAPEEYPADGKTYTWDEETTSWVESV